MGTSLDLGSQFSAHADALLSEVDAGRRAHAAKNIAESGKLFEASFRNLFFRSLPPTSSIVPGYFFDSKFTVNKQIDTLFCDNSEMIQLPPAKGLEQHYVPYNCVRAMAQVKNGASGLVDAMQQIASAISSWREMRKEDCQNISGEDDLKEPLAFVVIGRGGSESKVRKILASAPKPLPAYVLLLEKGLLYGRDNICRQVFDTSDACFGTQGNGGPLALLEAGDIGVNVKDKRGRLLMWVFFAIVYNLQPEHSGRAFRALKKKIESDFPLRYADLPAIGSSQ